MPKVVTNHRSLLNIITIYLIRVYIIINLLIFKLIM